MKSFYFIPPSRPRGASAFCRILLSAVLLFVALSVHAQDPSDQAETTVRIDTNIVLLDVQVLRKKTGAVVGTLKQNDFELFEDGVKQEVSYFSMDKLPLSILLLVDTSSSVRPIIEIIRDGAMQALGNLKPEDELAVMVFGDETKLIQSFTKDRQIILAQIGKLVEQTRVGVGTALDTAIYQAAAEITRASNPLSRRVIIAVTDNIATAYRHGSLSQKEITDRLYDSGVVFCSVVVRPDSTKNIKLFQQIPPNDPYRKRIQVDEFIEQTGGEVMVIPAIEVNSKLAELIGHLRTRYSIGYSSNNQKLDGGFRRIRLAVLKEAQKREGEVVVRTRQGYYSRERERRP